MMPQNHKKPVTGTLKLRWKIFISFLSVCLIPLMLVSWLNYNITMSHTSEIMTDFVHLFSSQLNAELEGYVLSIDNISKAIINDRNTLEFLALEKDFSVYDRIAGRRIIENHIHNMTLQKTDLKEIYIVGMSEIVYSAGRLNKPYTYEDVKEQNWFKRLIKSTGNMLIIPKDTDEENPPAPDTQFLILGRALKDEYGNLYGIIAYEAKIDNIINANLSHKDIIKEYDIGLEVQNRMGEYLYNMPSKTTQTTGSKVESGFVSFSHYLSKYGLTVSISIPKTSLYKKIYFIRNFNFLVVISAILLTLLLSLLLSHNITKPLSRLAKSMKLLQEQKYDFIPDTGRDDEIGNLTRVYNQMVSRINTLINEVYITKLHERKAQFAALQSQINPHMLYNTIECIRMKAALNDDNEVSNMVRDLGRIFQLTLAKNKERNTIRDEMEYIVTYINLLNIRQDNRYRVDNHLPPEIMDAEIIRFCFQPIVENCIIHGFNDNARKCIISFFGKMVDGDILLTIKDNGQGLDAVRLTEVRENLLTASDVLSDCQTSIGLKNVYDRIKLEYGESYYLKLRSANKKGTAVEIFIPFRGG